jgi:plastocyanin
VIDMRARAFRGAAPVMFAAVMYAGAAAAAPAVHTVTIDGFEFRPASITVNRGDTIVWRNADPVPHTATAKDAALDSGDIGAGQAFRFTATKPGRFDYVCALHSTMKGTLIVR